MRFIHNSLHNIQHHHACKNQLVHHNLSLSQLNHGQIVVDNVKTVTCRLSNVTFSLVRIRNRFDVHTLTELLNCFPIHCIAKQLVQVFLKIQTCLLTLLRVELNVRGKICLLIKSQYSVYLLYIHFQLCIQLEISEIQYISYLIIQIRSQSNLFSKILVTIAII